MAISGKGISAIDALDSISGASTTDATITASDKILFQDVDDGDNVKSDTVQGILDLAGGGGGGAIAQVATVTQTGVVATSSVIPHDDSVPQNTEGAELFTLSITPASATNKLIISFITSASSAAATRRVTCALFQDSTASALNTASVICDNASGAITLGFTHVMTAGTTSPTTFKVRFGGNDGNNVMVNGLNNVTTWDFGGTTGCSLVIYEVTV